MQAKQTVSDTHLRVRHHGIVMQTVTTSLESY
jgi:hypothetical protein